MSQTRKRGKLRVQQRTFQNTVGVLQPLIGKVPSIMSKERMSLLGFKKKYFCIFLDGVTHINPLYYWKSMPLNTTATTWLQVTLSYKRIFREEVYPGCMPCADLSFSCI